jgi:4-diphosphocytidyl-2-C-methyl-D-erythritol kinase
MERTFLSPAKVNLLLKVLSKRPDGYHDILSIVDLVSLYDVIYMEDEPSGTVVVKDDKGVLPVGEKNTIYRAAMLLKEEYGISKGIRIFIEKHIPIGSGLGGPSSNAATTLKALAGVWEIAIEKDKLLSLGARVGADVPLFLHGRPCVMTGIGEKVSSVALPPLWYIIVYPDVVMSTPEVYSRVRIVLTKGENDIKLRSKFDSAYDVSRILENDLENVGILMCPTIKNIKDRLIASGSLGALMSGSGSSVFGIFKGEEEAMKAVGSINDMGSVFLAHSI